MTQLSQQNIVKHIELIISVLEHLLELQQNFRLKNNRKLNIGRRLEKCENELNDAVGTTKHCKTFSNLSFRYDNSSWNLRSVLFQIEKQP